MNINSKELEREEKHLEYTIDTIKAIIDEKNVSIEDYKSSIVERKRFLYEHSTEFFGSDLHALMNEEDLNVDIVNKDIIKVYKLYRSMETPYFSRIDFTSNGESESFYIGLTGIDRDYDPIVYDWRTPIANLYYNCGLGNSWYEANGVRVEGTTTLKRQFDIRMGKIVLAYDNEVGVPDAILEATLASNRSEYMRNIVDTIQKEQNEIIRYPASSTIVVEGVAGSGKTSVALHRIAYLLYNQKNLSNRNVLIFSPTEKFTHYISNVLPELGEENVSTTTFKEFAKNYIKNAEVEEMTEFIERYYRCHDSIDENRTKFKLSDAYKTELAAHIQDYFASLRFTKKIGLKATFITASELNEMKDNVPENLSFHDRLLYLSDRITAKFRIDEIANSKKMYKVIYKMLGIEENPIKLYNLLTGELSGERINYEDLFGILYTYFEINGYPELGFIKEVVIDEAQDYSLWQFEMIKKIFSSASFTILGDRNQSINPYLQYDSLEEITKVFKSGIYKPLLKTYRSSKEIIDYASRVLGLKKVESVRPSNSIPVETFKSNDLIKDIDAQIEKFKSMSLEKICVITKTSGESEKIASSILNKQVEVLPVYMAKGLEFDAVIIATESDSFNENERTLFYVAATRALHALTVINQNSEITGENL